MLNEKFLLSKIKTLYKYLMFLRKWAIFCLHPYVVKISMIPK